MSLGVYLDVVRPGTLRVGDLVDVLHAESSRAD
jgi:hypothetical protein